MQHHISGWISSSRGNLHIVAVGTCAILSMVGATGAHAADPFLPAPVYEAELHAGGRFVSNDLYQDATGIPGHLPATGPQTWQVSNHTESYCCGFDTHATTTTSNDGGGIVSTEVSSNNWTASAWARMTYYITVIGPDAASVPITISGYGFAEASSPLNFANAHADIMIRHKDPVTGQLDEVTDAFGNHQQGTFSETIDVIPNISYYQGATSIILTAWASVGTNQDVFQDVGYGGTGRSYIDPIFTIADPRLASLYTIIGVPVGAVLPPTAVPEPASWALMLGGFGAIGGMLRRQRRTTVAFA